MSSVIDEPYIFTTIRWDAELGTSSTAGNRSEEFLLLSSHVKRLRHAYQEFALWTKTDRALNDINLTTICHDLVKVVDSWPSKAGNGSSSCLRIKHRIYGDGRTLTECFPLGRQSKTSLLPSCLKNPDELAQRDIGWTAVLDANGAVTIRPSTTCKTSERHVYDQARQHAGIASLTVQKDVLLRNEDGHILDASISTPYFYRNSRWTTPSHTCGGQQGASRDWALQQGLAIEGLVFARDVRDGELIWLSNALRGFFPARVVGATACHG